MITSERLAEIMEGEPDLERVKRALIREAIIRKAMRESGEDRKTVMDMMDAMGSMDQEAVLNLTEGEPTTLAEALDCYVDALEQAATADETVKAEDVCDALHALLTYPWPGVPNEEATWRSRLAQEVYQHADRIEREPETRSLGVALASVVRHVGDQIGKMPG